MPVLLWLRYMMLGLLLVSVAGCGYHLTNSQPHRFGAARTIWVPFFGNESISPTAQTVLRRAFYDELHALRGLNPAETEATADLVIKARLFSYSSRAVSYNTLDQARELILTLNVELEISQNNQTPPLWKGQLLGTQQYPASINLALQQNAEEQALDAAARIIAHTFIAALEESY
jgi:outer membrane lipopolysaccharide assembly protein LptE/RlpB